VSEYQYYEFLALDRPLTTAEQAEVRAPSTRARITATSFTYWIPPRLKPRAPLSLAGGLYRRVTPVFHPSASSPGSWPRDGPGAGGPGAQRFILPGSISATFVDSADAPGVMPSSAT